MPRVRLTARGWLAVAMLGAGVCVAPARAAPYGAGRQEAQAPPADGRGPRSAEVEARRREEIDALQRQDVADALKKHFNITVDWRTTPLDKLIDIRVRAAKAAELQQRLGVSVDWQRFSWIELEALRRTLISIEGGPDGHVETAAAAPLVSQPLPPPSDDGLVRPTFKGRPAGKGGRSTDPDGVIRPTFTGRVAAPSEARDPDGVIRPTFAVRPKWSSAGADPDGLITPTFAPMRRFAPIGDADDLIDPTQTTGGRTTPARW
jgi:hypothetical protein